MPSVEPTRLDPCLPPERVPLSLAVTMHRKFLFSLEVRF